MVLKFEDTRISWKSRDEKAAIKLLVDFFSFNGFNSGWLGQG